MGAESNAAELDLMWARHSAEWRDSAQIASQWEDAAAIDPRLLDYTVEGDWWGALASTHSTLLVTREYEHLVMAICVTERGPLLSYFKLPHPSGLCADTGTIYVASTRNPNQVFDFAPVTGHLPRLDITQDEPDEKVLLPVRSRFFPGCFYMHDLALIGGELYANSVGSNSVMRLHPDSSAARVWWPECIDTPQGTAVGQNYIQLNSIAAGHDIASSYFSASADVITELRPGHPDYPVDKRGVIFSGATRQPIARGLTRPHSARLSGDQLWVDNSGYGEVGLVADGRFNPVAALPGWTRGLALHDHIAFVGTSRVISRFRQYAPGLDVDSSLCGLHAVEKATGRVIGSLLWPFGNQIFAIELVSDHFTTGFPFRVGAQRATEREKNLFYTFTFDHSIEENAHEQ
jgi:uncharacterized protein (TIGR03032 family)